MVIKCLVSGWKLSSSVGGVVGGVLVRVLKNEKLCVGLSKVISLIKAPDVSRPWTMIRINSLEGAAGPQKVCIACRFLAVQSSKSWTRQLPRSGDGPERRESWSAHRSKHSGVSVAILAKNELLTQGDKAKETQKMATLKASALPIIGQFEKRFQKIPRNPRMMVEITGLKMCPRAFQ